MVCLVSIKAQHMVSRLGFRIARGLVAISPASLKERRMIGIAEAYALVHNNKTKIGSGELLASQSKVLQQPLNLHIYNPSLYASIICAILGGVLVFLVPAAHLIPPSAQK
ncbi:hypothetical protein TWF173_009662 [Orbilia oligospora]|nr:hypothetical protein TWF173_009662 [Orbilia oligospora]